MDTLELTNTNEPMEVDTTDKATEPAQQENEQPTAALLMTKEEVMARVKQLADDGETSDKQELDLLKQLYYRHHNAQATAQREAYIEAGGNPDEFLPEPDPTEEQFKQYMQIIRQRRAEMQQQIERQRQENLSRKLSVIERIQTLAQTPEEANKSYEDFRALQAEWKQAGPVPAEHVTETWNRYQLCVEQFYDMLKLNSQMREYDFKKNLEAKLILCQQAEKLKDETDVVAAINKLQTLHADWKEIGPIAKELREEIWNRFRDASTVIRKRHQEHFEARKAQELDNLKRKEELCQKAEEVNTEGLKTFAEWEEQTKVIIALQAEWKTIGFAPQKHNQQVFERFRAAADRFFTQKADYFHQVKDTLQDNLKRKEELCQKAEEISVSTDWRSATEAIVALQKEWKTIGAVPRKQSDSIWRRFNTACDAFFEAKQKAHAELRGEQTDNLKAKKEIVAQLEALLAEGAEPTTAQVKQLQEQWASIGHVPIKEKERMYAKYRAACDELYSRLGARQSQRRVQSFRNAVKLTAKEGGTELQRERQRLQRAYEQRKQEIETYENNLGFLSANSKKGNALVADVAKKIDKLKAELNELGQKIKAIAEEERNAQHDA